MNQERKGLDKNVTAAAIAAIAVICAATISLITPFSQKIADRLFPNPTAASSPIVLPEAQVNKTKEWWISTESNCEGAFNIYAINPDKGIITKLTHDTFDNGDSVVSPNGKEIAFFSERNGDREIYTMSITGENLKRITYSSGWDGLPAWSPDGTQLAYTAWRDSAPGIFITNIDGTDIKPVTTSQLGDWMPDWSPDGSKIVFAAWEQEDISEIYVVDVNGNHRTKLTNLKAQSFGPKWSPDGSQIVFYSNKEGTNQVYAMDQDGNRVKKITEAYEYATPIRNPWSADGQKILYVTNDGIYGMNKDGSNSYLIQHLQQLCY